MFLKLTVAPFFFTWCGLEEASSGEGPSSGILATAVVYEAIEMARMEVGVVDAFLAPGRTVGC